MTLRIHAPNPIRVGETGNVLVYSDNPGVVSLAYGAGLTGPATVEITGTRVWRNGLKHGQYLARANCLQARDNCALFVELRGADLMSDGYTAYTYSQIPLMMSWNAATRQRYNWKLLGHLYQPGNAQGHFDIRYVQSASSAANEVLYTGPQGLTWSTIPETIRVIITLSGTTVTWYITTGTASDGTATRAATSGTMGGTEITAIMFPGKYAKMEGGLPSQAQREAFMSAGTLPAGLSASYQGGHEIVESAPVFWDSASTLDLTATNVTYWPAAAASGDYTDSSPVTPYALIAVTAVSTTGCTIDATRPRQGVPSRASEAEKTETATQCTVTVEAALPPCFAIGPDLSTTAARFPNSRRFTVYSQTDGAVTLESDNAKVLVPASVVVVDGFVVFDVSISGAVSGVTITATQGAATATCSVAVALAAPVVPTMAANDTLQLFPEWLWTEPHTQGISAVMDDRRAAFVSDLDHLLIYDFANQTSAMLDLVAEMFAIYGRNKAAGTTEKVAFLESSLKILRKSGTHYAVKEAIRLVCDTAKIESITIIDGVGGLVYDGSWVYDGSETYDSHYHWARFDVEIETTDAAYFTAEIQAVIVSMINHYKPASRWLESLIITEI